MIRPILEARISHARRATVFLALFAMATAALGIKDERPNIVIILVDDMGWSDIASYGGEIPTPHLDALARNGLRFTQFYNTSRCSPTRASMLTGHYPHQAGMGYLDGMVVEGSKGFQGRIADTSATMAEVLREAGYLTAVTGKWHIGQQNGTPPWKTGFERNLTMQAGGKYFPDQTGARGESPLFIGNTPYESTDPIFGDYWYGTDLWTEWGVRFIDEALDSDRPFFLFLSHVAPHFPLMAPQETIAKYRGKYMAGWDQLRKERLQRQIEMELIDPSWALPPTEEETPRWDDLPNHRKNRFDHIMAIYAALVDHIDQSTGYLVEALEHRGVLDNTIILFLSDNGSTAESGPDGRARGNPLGGPDSGVWLGMNWASLGNTPFRRFKHFTHEGGIATPLIVHWPARLKTQGEAMRSTKEGSIVDLTGHLIDLMPTIIDITGARYPEVSKRGAPVYPMEGVSYKELFLEGKPFERSQPIFFEHEGNRAVRDGKWKLVSRHLEPWMLHDMEKDRTELVDLSSEHPEIVERLRKAYHEWAERTHVDEWTGGPRTSWGNLIRRSRR